MFLVKNLPSKKLIKEFYNINESRSFTVIKVDISKRYITLSCKIKSGRSFFMPSFYQNLQSMDNKGGFTMYIKNEYYYHLTININSEMNYLRGIKK